VVDARSSSVETLGDAVASVVVKSVWGLGLGLWALGSGVWGVGG